MRSFDMSDYKLLDGGGVKHVPSGRSIPDDPRNRHWQEYQNWLAAGNTPEPADPEPEPSQMPSDAERIAALESIIATLL
jgi:hypothetical protein